MQMSSQSSKRQGELQESQPHFNPWKQKIMECLIFQAISSYMEEKKVTRSSHHGFTKEPILKEAVEPKLPSGNQPEPDTDSGKLVTQALLTELTLQQKQLYSKMAKHKLETAKKRVISTINEYTGKDLT
ncbi:hypothetical protein BTVI_103394 [Pitangus sulphuratus]|nr:hypothetical protein BTVI_103394 [Pitangus sulphuratus]